MLLISHKACRAINGLRGTGQESKQLNLKSQPRHRREINFSDYTAVNEIIPKFNVVIDENFHVNIFFFFFFFFFLHFRLLLLTSRGYRYIMHLYKPAFKATL